ncbi:Pyruvate decarboxylase isozyme 2 [Tetrabaena socialis]|uniref:pyruvate decarboxylase n=1 Tax=Tetrabaena socialis TaxID=47790 RepID=A0A2J7ZT31_9CHLO|nr:Pyruvate decarboxylase isozyme 2 [Tetrabaena socialis]|eukprot:PNH03431.1 Pyruvate decarboxylase isozyme 2 [Tetrabaena socialis]
MKEAFTSGAAGGPPESAVWGAREGAKNACRARPGRHGASPGASLVGPPPPQQRQPLQQQQQILRRPELPADARQSCSRSSSSSSSIAASAADGWDWPTLLMLAARGAAAEAGEAHGAGGSAQLAGAQKGLRAVPARSRCPATLPAVRWRHPRAPPSRRCVAGLAGRGSRQQQCASRRELAAAAAAAPGGVGRTGAAGWGGDAAQLAKQQHPSSKLAPAAPAGRALGGMERPTDDYKRTHNLVLKPRDTTFGGQVSFSALNAVAGAYSEDLPLIVISGGPNSCDQASNRVLHHTTGAPDYGQQLRAFKEVTCFQVVIQHIEDAYKQLDAAISKAMMHRKPVYIEVACNLADLTHPSFIRPPVPYALASHHTNTASLEAAVDATVEWLGSKVKPVLLAGGAGRALVCVCVFVCVGGGVGGGRG